MEFFHVDVWTNNATTFRIKLVDLGGEATEGEIVFEGIEKDKWVSLEIPMSDFRENKFDTTINIFRLTNRYI